MRKSVSVALCGVIAALCTVIMVLAGVLQIATLALPALSGILLLVLVIELGTRWAWAVYAVVSVLSFFMVADKEAVVMFVLFFGYYPILKVSLERIRIKWLSWAVKFLVFNAGMIAAYFISIFWLGIPQESFFVFGVFLPWVLLLVGNGVFLLYDYAISGLIVGYCSRLRKNIRKIFR